MPISKQEILDIVSGFSGSLMNHCNIDDLRDALIKTADNLEVMKKGLEILLDGKTPSQVGKDILEKIRKGAN